MITTRASDLVLLVNHATADHLPISFPAANIAAVMRLPDGAPQSWVNEQRSKYLTESATLANAHKQKLFLVSAGPMAKVLVSHMWRASQENQYVDIGSSLDEIGRGLVSRPYMNVGSHYSRQVDRSWYVNPQTGELASI